MKIETNTFHFPVTADDPASPSADGENEFAAFAEQFANRAERLRQARIDEPSRHAVEAVTDVEGSRAATVWVGALLLSGLAAAALFVWSWPIAAITGSSAGGRESAAVEASPRPVSEPQQAANVALPPLHVALSPPASARSDPAPVPPSPPAPTAHATDAATPAEAAAPLPAETAATKIADVTAATTKSAAPRAAATSSNSTPLSSQEVRELQTRLQAAGFHPGAIDGVVGPRTSDAARRYGEARRLASTDPARDMLVRLRAEDKQSAQAAAR